MTVNELVDLLNDYGFEDTEVARKLEALTAAVWEICSLHPWDFLLKETSALSLSARTPTMPSDFDKVRTAVIPSVGRVLQPITAEDLIKRGCTLTDTGVPAYYYFIGETFYIYPVPSSTYTATLVYYAKQSELAADGAETTIVIPPKHHRCIAYRALVDLYEMEDDPELATTMEDRYNRRLAFMNADATKQFDRDERIYDLDRFEDADLWL